MQGSLWKKKYENLNQPNVTLPLVEFFDNFEPGNGLGSHAGDQKLDGIYMSMPFLPFNSVSKLKNILVSSVFYFAFVLITGDNLNLNSSCGFSQGFNSLKGYWCRSCRATGEEVRYLIEEIPELLRNDLNYEKDLRNKTGGIKEKCIFNEIDNFHIAINQIFARDF
ncbi:hypothetical protein TKK_0002881 [Trichogramma kaykai]